MQMLLRQLTLVDGMNMSDPCLYFVSSNCYKNSVWYDMQVSGDCLSCLLAMDVGGFINTKTLLLTSSRILMSGSRPQ